MVFYVGYVVWGKIKEQKSFLFVTSVVIDLMDKIWTNLMKIGNWFGCHQLQERSFFISGYQLPLCARCTGIFTGTILAIPILILKIDIPTYILVISLFPMILDGMVQYFNIFKSTNFRRFITGFLFGFSHICIIVKLITYFF
jgi:uncharacterized membrane protein